MADLLSCSDVELWSKALNVYRDVVQALEDQKNKRKGAKKDQESLTSLDNWYQQDLPTIVQSRDPPFLNHEELSRLMKWKLMRGKFRPRLTEMVKENDPTQVKQTTTKAFSQLPNVSKAVETLKTLKAVGPATASAILCVFKPEMAPFMSDEATIAVEGIKKLDYSLKQYLVFTEAMCEKAAELSKLGDKRWSAHDVELALWSHSLAKIINPDILKTSTRSSPNSSDSDDTPPKKKRC